MKSKVGVIGCGNISSAYFKIAKGLEDIEIVACADLVREKAEARAAEFQIPRVCTVEEMLADKSIELILNLTLPQGHAAVDIAALEAGKHVYAEKPLAISREDGRKVLDLAARKKLRVGSAPDTFLGGGIQTCCKLINDGWIGTPVAAAGFMLCRGHESWHPDPEFYYLKGGGPMFDMGPYYLTAMVALMGPVRRVTGSARMTFPERLITSQPKCGKKIPVETPTHLAAVLDFANGAVATLVTSFDVWAGTHPPIEIYGTEGSLMVPDPNTFGGPVKIRRMGSKDWSDVPLAYGYAENSRGLGLADMAQAIRVGRPHRASGELAFHVLDVMHAVHEASAGNAHVTLKSTCEQPAPLPLGLRPGTVA